MATLTAGCGGVVTEEGEVLFPEAGEEFSGGDTTVFVNTAEAFSKNAANLDFNQEGDFKIGNSFFEQDWVMAPSSTTARDGLGPVFNARSCAACHNKDGRGLPPLALDEKPLGLLFRLSIPGTTPEGGPVPEPNYGGQLQNRANPGIPLEGDVLVDYDEIPGSYGDGEAFSLRNPLYLFFDLGFGDFQEDFMFSPRIAPQMPGMGLLEAIAQEDIESYADPEDVDGDGISGRPNYVWDVIAGETTLGRFGWKANVPSVRQQVSGAFHGDIGITSSIFPGQPCTAVQTDCLNAVDGGMPEIQDDVLDLVVFYSQTLAVPGRRDWEDPDVLAGKKIFNEIGCAQCHRQKFTTAGDFPMAPLAGQSIFPYTDLLLHDMGEGLADHRPDFEADGREWRTPPLWGVGLIETVNGHNFLLHDGRARGLAEAILWHGGEGEAAKERFRNLTKVEREQLLTFLRSL